MCTWSDERDLCRVLIGGALTLRMLTGLVRTERKSLSLLFLLDPWRESHPSTSPRKLRLSLFWKYPTMEGLFLCSVARPAIITCYQSVLNLPDQKSNCYCQGQQEQQLGRIKGRLTKVWAQNSQTVLRMIQVLPRRVLDGDE